MSANDLLSQEEIDALLHGVDNGDLGSDDDLEVDVDAVRSYDFASQDRIVRGRLPTLEMVNERFARLFRIGLFNILRRSPEIAVGGVQMLKFSEYIHSLFVPTSLNLVKMQPLRGTALFVFNPKQSTGRIFVNRRWCQLRRQCFPRFLINKRDGSVLVSNVTQLLEGTDGTWE